MICTCGGAIAGAGRMGTLNIAAMFQMVLEEKMDAAVVGPSRLSCPWLLFK
jgi:hypothetical protein